MAEQSVESEGINLSNPVVNTYPVGFSFDHRVGNGVIGNVLPQIPDGTPHNLVADAALLFAVKMSGGQRLFHYPDGTAIKLTILSAEQLKAEGDAKRAEMDAALEKARAEV